MRKEKKKEKKQVKQKKREEEREEETCMVESFAFGDVAQAPPSLPKPKKAPVTLVQKQADLQRLKAIEAYRLLKQKKRAGASKDDAPVYL